jgi:hypothetical protein
MSGCNYIIIVGAHMSGAIISAHMLERKCRRANIGAHMSGFKCEIANVMRAYRRAQKSPTRPSAGCINDDKSLAVTKSLAAAPDLVI